MATTATFTRLISFYCRVRNRLVDLCPRTGGPRTCPVRNECSAYCAAEAEAR